MARNIEIQIISRETVKPFSPTPPHLRTYNLSLLDQLTTRIYVPMLLFYSTNLKHSHTYSSLKNSLSETLTKYYPFAGRLTSDRVAINCSDEGVDFLEAEINCQLSEFLKQFEGDSKILNILCREGFLWNYGTSKDSLLGVQVSFFKCGSVAISVSFSHKIADGCTISTFLGDWAATTPAVSLSPPPPPPEFIATSILPQNVPINIALPEIEFEKKKCVTKRYVFNASKIAKLKAMAGVVKNPTRVEVVTALLYKCAVISSLSNPNLLRNPLLIQLVNMRPRMVPPLPRNSIGNFSWYFTVSQNKKMKEMKFHELVLLLRNGITQLCDKNTNNLKLNDWLAAVLETTKEVKILFDDIDVYRCSSFCRYPLYQVDFGWGKPIWVPMADGVVKNAFVLMDTPTGDGIEATVTLEEQDMGIFQCNEELLAFASPINLLNLK